MNAFLRKKASTHCGFTCKRDGMLQRLVPCVCAVLDNTLNFSRIVRFLNHSGREESESTRR